MSKDYQHEILINSDTILDLMQTKLYENPDLTKKQTKKVLKAMDLIAEVYQIAGERIAKNG